MYMFFHPTVRGATTYAKIKQDFKTNLFKALRNTNLENTQL